MSDSTIDILLYVAWCLHAAAACWFVYRMIAAELRARRERRAAVFEPLEMGTPAKLHDGPPEMFSPAVRGYDSPELLRQDTVARIRQIEKEIAENLRQIEHRHK